MIHQKVCFYSAKVLNKTRLNNLLLIERFFFTLNLLKVIVNFLTNTQYIEHIKEKFNPMSSELNDSPHVKIT